MESSEGGNARRFEWMQVSRYALTMLSLATELLRITWRVLTTDASMTPAAARARSSAASGSKVPAASDLRSVERWDR